MKFFQLAVATTAFAVAGIASAATQGQLAGGTTGFASSDGTADVLLIKDDAVKISDLNDFDFLTLTTAPADLVKTDDVCVFNSTATYKITISSPNAFVMQGDLVGDVMPFSLTWGGTAVTSGTPLTGLVGDRSDPDCADVTPTLTAFEVTIAKADFDAAPVGSYSETVTLMVEPE